WRASHDDSIMRAGSITLALLAAAQFTASSYAGTRDRHGSTYTAVSWSQKDGLASPIWAITQDRSGYLWLGTDEGLVRFDGVRFVVWEPPVGPALPSSEVRQLVAGSDGSLWIGFDGAALVSRLRDGIVTTYTSRDGLPNGSVLAVIRDQQGT